jgi:hypothetical protein
MKCLVILFLISFLSYGQIDESFDSFDGTGEWTSPGGNTGSHAGDLCFNITGNYLAGQFYVFQSPMYDFSTWSNVELLWRQESDVRPGDVFGLYFYDNGWFFYDISNLNGFYGVTLPTTTVALAFVLNTSGSGSLNNKYSHVEFVTIYDPQPLPVEQLEFTAKLLEEGVQLNWSTASEYNSNYFGLFRSINGYDWNLITEIPAAGFSTSNQEYRYVDHSLIYNHIYYKLKQTDIDGAVESWEPISIYRELEKNKTIYNMLGQEVKNSYKGLYIELNNGVYRKKIKN